jgi:DNA-3-methyladenine glycosylase II
MVASTPDTPDAHLAAADPVLAELIGRYGPFEEALDLATDDLFEGLLLAMAGRRFLTHRARAAFAELRVRFGNRTPTPAELLAAGPAELRPFPGLRTLAGQLASGRLGLQGLRELDDEQVRTALRAVAGPVADMFLIYSLGRPDVVACTDPDLRRAIRRSYRLPALPGPDLVNTIAEPWRPYRTRACLYLWQSW